MTNHDNISQSIIKSIETLPILSSCAAELISTINNDHHNLNDIIKITECDASLTSEIIKLANSPIYSFPTTITSLDKAIALMGEEAVINLVLNAAATNIFDKSLQGYESEAGALWEHDLKTAIASREISKFSIIKISPHTAYTGGLLHDIGKSLISKYLKGTAPKILKALDQGKIDNFSEAEEKISGTTHAQVGSEIAQYWHLPEPLPSIIKFHHTPSKSPEEYKNLVFCVHLGDIIAMLSGCGTGVDSLAYGIDDSYSEYIAIDKNELMLVMLDVEEKYSKIKSAIFTGGENK